MESLEYAEYLAVVGKVKDVMGLTVEVPHKDIHTFFKDKTPLFKLLYGTFEESKSADIVISFHVDVPANEAMQQYYVIHKIHPWLKLVEEHIEDDAGETYMGEDARILRDTFLEQVILKKWLEKNDPELIREFVGSQIVGRERDLSRSYSANHERDLAIREFEMMQKPLKKEEVH